MSVSRLPPSGEPPFDPDYDRPVDQRQPPQDTAAEQAVLGALLVHPHVIDTITAQINPDDHYRPAHETIHAAILKLHADGNPIDPITVANHLHTTGDLTKVGGAPYIHTLQAAAPLIPEHAEHHAIIVRDKARLRAVVATGTRLTQLGYTARVDQVDAYLGEALQVLDDVTMRFGDLRSPTTSGLKDLSWILTGQTPHIPPPTWVQHDAGHALFYAGKVNGIFGDPETAKTFLAQLAIVEALNTGGTAAMVDVDHNGENHTAARLLLLGARPEHIANLDRFRYYDPEDGTELRAALDDITHHQHDVVLIDSLGEIFPMLGLNTNDGDEVTGGLRLLSRPAQAGACVIFIDHLPKSTEARNTGFAIGSIAKKRAVRGAYIRAEERTKPAPGQIGRISLFIEKDTAGELRRAVPGGKFLGTFVLDSTDPRITTARIIRDDAPTNDDGTIRPTHLMEAISRHVEQNDLCSFRGIKEGVTGKDKWVRQAIRLLIEEGFMSTIAGPNNSTRHHAIALYREAEDDHAN